MNKDEILQRSRAENKDEGEIHALRTGQSWGFLGSTVMYLLLVFISLVCNPSDMDSLTPLHAIYCTSSGFYQFGYAQLNRKKLHLAFGIILILFGILFTILYITDLLA